MQIDHFATSKTRGSSFTTARSALLVAATDSMCCARVPGLLARAGWQVSVLAPNSSPALSSRHVGHRMPVAKEGEAVLRQLRSLCNSVAPPFDWVIPGDEDMIAMLAARLEEPWARACFPVRADARSDDIISCKTSFIAACQSAGVPVPMSEVCSGPGEALSASLYIGFPLLLKADFGASGTTVWQIADQSELMSALPRTADRPFTLQAIVKGESGVTEMLCVDGRPLAVVSSLMRGIDPVPFGPASSRLYQKNREAEAMASLIARLTRFNGFCGFDWIRSGGPGGPVFAIEFHPRPTLGFHMAHHAGVDFTAAARQLLSGADGILPEQPSGETPCLFFPKDLMRALRRHDIRGLLRWFPGVSHTDLPWNDLPLALNFVARLAKSRSRAVPRGRATPAIEDEAVTSTFTTY